eukprot:5700972-Amphidinium_carterae.1
MMQVLLHESLKSFESLPYPRRVAPLTRDLPAVHSVPIAMIAQMPVDELNSRCGRSKRSNS